MKNTHRLLFILLVVSLLLRLWRINFPQANVFDEVYYPFTAKEYLAGNPHAWEWGATAPKGYAYAWVNPPFAQELMAVAMKVEGSTDYWAFRLPGVLMNILAIYLLFLLAKQLFQSERVALLAAFFFAFDGLNFVQSRTGMLDIYLTTFILAAVYFFCRQKYWASALTLAMAISTKWTGLYLLPLFFGLLLWQRRWWQILNYLIIIPLFYLGVYLPFFLTGHHWQDFIELLKQEWWYHTHLKATHAYASAWWSWPFDLYPVWYYVQYYPNNYMANIFAAGNPIVFWLGSISVVLSAWQWLWQRSQKLFIPLAASALLWLPWAASPRIMFLYYFAPVVPFICLLLADQLNQIWTTPNQRKIAYAYIALTIICFVGLFPFLIGLPLPRQWVNLFFLTNLAKNPFGG